jgi:uncharacterized protein (DUF1697 family)
MGRVPTYVALLRGINVGGRNKVAMSDLRDVVTSLGHSEVTTYIQSGNIVFGTKKTSTSTLAAGLERAIESALGVRPRVVVLSRDELAAVIAANPYPDEPNPKAVHAIFLADPPERDVADRIAEVERRAAEKGGRDEVRLIGRTLYLHTPDGFGRSELAALLLRSDGKSIGASATARNWATATKLLELCG